MRRHVLIPTITTLLVSLACQDAVPAPSPPYPTDRPDAGPTQSVFDSGRTTHGFFPSPPEATFESIMNHFAALGEHADFILIQPNIPWRDFQDAVEGSSQARDDLKNQIILAEQHGLEWIFVVDPLNGLNRREFFELPFGWEASFENPNVRAAFTHFAQWIVQEFQPHYLGLASEINTYMDAHPDDVEHYLSLYGETYEWVKREAPETQVFVTFQWDDLNNMFPPAAEGRPQGQTNWDQVEAFEPKLDLWVISSYPYFVFPSGDAIPDDYYTPLLERTDKLLAVAEGGYTSRPVGPVPGRPEDQIAYLEAIHDQLGERLSFWVYIILNDLNMDSISDAMRDQGRAETDVETLSMFANVGLREADNTPKPALEVWDRFRQGE